MGLESTKRGCSLHEENERSEENNTQLYDDIISQNKGLEGKDDEFKELQITQEETFGGHLDLSVQCSIKGFRHGHVCKVMVRMEMK